MRTTKSGFCEDCVLVMRAGFKGPCREHELEARCAELEEEAQENARIIGMSGSRELTLLTKIRWQADIISRAKRIIEMLETVDEPIEDWLSDLEKGPGNE